MHQLPLGAKYCDWIKAVEYSWEASDLNYKRSTSTKNMKIMKGYKVVICGSVVSGKSILHCSIFGEIPRISGSSIKVYG